MPIITNSSVQNVSSDCHEPAINSGILDLNISLHLKSDLSNFEAILGGNLRGKLTVQVANARPKCIAAHISARDLLDLPDRLWWKDAEVCEDIKFAIHVFCMATKHSMTGLTVWRLLTDHKLHLLFGS